MALTCVSVPCGHIIQCLAIETFLGFPCYFCGQTIELMSPNPIVIEKVAAAKKKHYKLYNDGVANKTADYLENLKTNILLCFDNVQKSNLTSGDSIEYIKKNTECLISEVEDERQTETEHLKITHDDNFKFDLDKIFKEYINDLLITKSQIK